MMHKLKVLFSLAGVALILNGGILPVNGASKDSNLGSSTNSEASSDPANANNRSDGAPPLNLRKLSRGILSVTSEEEVNKVVNEILVTLKSYREVAGATEKELNDMRDMKLAMLKDPNPTEEQRNALMKKIASFDNAILNAH